MELKEEVELLTSSFNVLAREQDILHQHLVVLTRSLIHVVTELEKRGIIIDDSINLGRKPGTGVIQ